MNRILITSLCFCLLLVSCDGGLTLPPDIEPGISGTLTVVSPWPPQDSVKALLLFASQIFPIDSATVFKEIIDGRILIYPPSGTLQYNVNVQPFNFPLDPATYFYVGVLQRFGDVVVDLGSYQVAGMYNDPLNPTQPLAVTIGEFEVVQNVDITVDFYNLPPQPF